MTPEVHHMLGVSPGAAAAAMDELVREALGVEPVGPAEVTEIDYACDSPATGGLYRVSGRTTDGAGWSLFCKLIQHVRHWPKLVQLPEPLRADFAEQLPWRAELQLWDPAMLATMPDGLRAPRLHRLIDLGDDRLAIWQEDVRHVHTGWDLDRYGRAARLLGRWNARATGADALAVLDGFPVGFALRKYATNAVAFRGLAPLRDDDLWTHPWLAPHADLRADLLALGGRISELLDRLDALPQCAPHGDASPQNLLHPHHGEGSRDLVAIDLSFRSPQALGFDLGQLLVGLVHADAMPAAELPAIADRILAEYRAGLRDEGLPDDAAAEGFASSVLLRSGFDGFRYELLETGTDRAAFDQRVAMSRFLVDQFHALVG